MLQFQIYFYLFIYFSYCFWWSCKDLVKSKRSVKSMSQTKELASESIGRFEARPVT